MPGIIHTEAEPDRKAVSRVLVLTPELTDFLWLEQLFADTRNVQIHLTWCPDAESSEDLVQNARFDVILLDAGFVSPSPEVFLQFLIAAGGRVPLWCLVRPLKRAAFLYGQGPGRQIISAEDSSLAGTCCEPVRQRDLTGW